MKREDVKKLLENGVLQAYAEGKTLQAYDAHTKAWYDSSPPEVMHFVMPAENYRVKPEPLHDWVVCVEENDCFLLHGRTASWMKGAYGGEKAYSYRQLVPVTEEA